MVFAHVFCVPLSIRERSFCFLSHQHLVVTFGFVLQNVLAFRNPRFPAKRRPSFPQFVGRVDGELHNTCVRAVSRSISYKTRRARLEIRTVKVRIVPRCLVIFHVQYFISFWRQLPLDIGPTYVPEGSQFFKSLRATFYRHALKWWVCQCFTLRPQLLQPYSALTR